MLVANSHGQGQPLQPRPDLASDSTSAQTNQIHPLSLRLKYFHETICCIAKNDIRIGIHFRESAFSCPEPNHA